MSCGFQTTQLHQSTTQTKMVICADIPQEYQDVVFGEIAYDPVRLPEDEDPTQYLYDRKTLEIIWESNRRPLNPFTRMPFDISHVIPQTSLRAEMARNIPQASTKVIEEYMIRFTEDGMKDLLTDFNQLVNEVAESPNDDELWNDIWRKLNRIRLSCQYIEKNRKLFQDIHGWDYVAGITRGVLRRQGNREQYMHVSREVVWLMNFVKITGLRIPLHSVVHCIAEVAKAGYVRLESIVLRAYHRIFCFYGHHIDMSEIFKQSLCGTVISSITRFLNETPVLHITNDDFLNCISVLKVSWMKKRDILLGCPPFPLAVARSLAVLTSRMSETEGGEKQKVNRAMEVVWELILDILKGTQNFMLLRRKLFELDLVKNVAKMAEMAISGFEFGDRTMELGFLVVCRVYEYPNKRDYIKDRHVASFSALFRNPVLMNYSERVRNQLERIFITVGISDLHYGKINF